MYGRLRISWLGIDDSSGLVQVIILRHYFGSSDHFEAFILDLLLSCDNENLLLVAAFYTPK